eukprot:4988325-Pleurochrysis_carterae.AAC.1
MCCTPRTTATVIITTLIISDTSGQPATGRSACPAGSSEALAGVRAGASGSLSRADASAWAMLGSVVCGDSTRSCFA